MLATKAASTSENAEPTQTPSGRAELRQKGLPDGSPKPEPSM
jgi:hypothetical protein